MPGEASQSKLSKRKSTAEEIMSMSFKQNKSLNQTFMTEGKNGNEKNLIRIFFLNLLNKQLEKS
jgi:hypothetical protein